MTTTLWNMTFRALHMSPACGKNNFDIMSATVWQVLLSRRLMLYITVLYNIKIYLFSSLEL